MSGYPKYFDMKNSAIKAVSNGLLVFAPPNEPFISRNGDEKYFLVDSRGAGTNIELREIVISEMVKCLDYFPDCNVIGGIAKSGTTWGAWLSWKLRIPFASILLDGKRKSGLQREIEGNIMGKNVVLIDNWLRTGTSIINSIEVVERNGGKVIGVIVITKLKEVTLQAKVVTVWELDELFEAAKKVNLVDKGFNFK